MLRDMGIRIITALIALIEDPHIMNEPHKIDGRNHIGKIIGSLIMDIIIGIDHPMTRETIGDNHTIRETTGVHLMNKENKGPPHESHGQQGRSPVS